MGTEFPTARCFLLFGNTVLCMSELYPNGWLLLLLRLRLIAPRDSSATPLTLWRVKRELTA